MSLSSSEAELYACSDAVKQIRYIVQVLCALNMEIELPVIVHVDNMGAVFMAENLASSARTKHMDLRARYVLNQMVDEKLM